MIAAVPAAEAGAPQTLLWFAWVLALGVIALRLPGRGVVPAGAALAASA